MQEDTHIIAPKPNWRQVATFLALTFGLTYLLDLVLYLTAGYGETASAVYLVQFQMLIPAAVAIVLLMFVFRESPIYHLKYLRTGKSVDHARRSDYSRRCSGIAKGHRRFL
jgi:hypothetical protein